MTAESIAEFFKEYKAAFDVYNLAKVAQCYHLPCTLHTPDNAILINNTNDFNQEFEQIFLQLQQANTRQINAENSSFTLLTTNVALVNIDWFFKDAHGEIFADFCAIYHLIKLENKIKIVNVVSHELSNSLTLAQPLLLAD